MTPHRTLGGSCVYTEAQKDDSLPSLGGGCELIAHNGWETKEPVGSSNGCGQI